MNESPSLYKMKINLSADTTEATSNHVQILHDRPKGKLICYCTYLTTVKWTCTDKNVTDISFSNAV